MSLLGGGALLVREAYKDLVPAVQSAHATGTALSTKACVFNALLQRRLYALVNRNPLFELGKTVYKPLIELRDLDALRRGAIAAAAERYLQTPRGVETAWERVCGELSLSKHLLTEPERLGRLLRYPLLCRDKRERDGLWRAFY